jgi:prolyl 4-hydroxylase
MNDVIREFEQRAQRGDIEANLALGSHFEAHGQSRLARNWYARAAKLGSLAAERSLAINLLIQNPIVQVEGVSMLLVAADKGDAEAAYVCGMLAAQGAKLEDRWKIAREWLERAAGLGWASAREQLEFLGPDFRAGNVSALAGGLPVHSVSEAARIFIVENCAAAETCDWLIERARPRMRRATVYNREDSGARIDEARSNSAIAFNIAQSDMVLMLLRERIAATTGLPLASMEPTSVLHYAPGEQFKPHYDFLNPDVPGYALERTTKGQRVATFLLYLNDDFEGGETDFPLLNYRYKGRKGDALLFWNVDPSGASDLQTLHAGLPTSQGEKWLLSQWLRERVR